MLRRLMIRDFVLVDRLELEFGAGFGALTGETGAGKSILIDALAFALGERADVGLIRVGSERAEVTVEFCLDALPLATEWLSQHDIDVEDGLLLRRVLDRNGRSRAYLNGSPATLQQLREMAEFLVDIHGQHAHQSLLRTDAQRALLDTHAGLDSLAAEVAAAWRNWREAKQALDKAESGAEALAQERDQLDWQVRELEVLGFSPDGWRSLNSEHRRLAHAVALAEGAQFSLNILAEGDATCETQIDRVVGRLNGLAEYDPALADVAALMATAQSQLGEAISALRRYAGRVEVDPSRLAEVEGRMESVLTCARKYRVTPDELPDLLARWQESLHRLGEAADIAGLQARCRTIRGHFDALAGRLSVERREAASLLGEEVSRVMQQLALGGGRFDVALLSVNGGNAFGFEQIEFRIAGLSGSESRPLAKVASGGELSRISLAVQVVTSQAARVPTLIFDEVDVGIGGGVAEVVGLLLHELGLERQVLCVTHLPQVAARADWQWLVAKRGGGDEIRSSVSILDADARVEELARMLGGVEITPITRQHAREMLRIL